MQYVQAIRALYPGIPPRLVGRALKHHKWEANAEDIRKAYRLPRVVYKYEPEVAWDDPNIFEDPAEVGFPGNQSGYKPTEWDIK